MYTTLDIFDMSDNELLAAIDSVFDGTDEEWDDFADDFMFASHADKEEITIDWLCDDSQKKLLKEY